MAIFLIEALEFANRTRDAIRIIKSVAVEDRSRKRLLSEWFGHHPRAAQAEGAKREAYDSLLGRAGNVRLRG